VPQPWSRRQSAPRVEINPREAPNFLFYSNVREQHAIIVIGML
jgi:hypothetical protein